MDPLITEVSISVVKIIWMVVGIISFLILKKTRKSFYNNRSPLWMISAYVVYILVSPLIFLVAIITLFNPEKNTMGVTEKL